MELLSWHWRGLRLTLVQCALCLGGIAAAGGPGGILPPTNLTVKLEDLFVLKWTWVPPQILPGERNCQLQYKCVIQEPNQDETSQRWSKQFCIHTPHNANDEICFKVRTECLINGTSYGHSTWEKICTSVMKGDLEMPVTDFKCIWFSGEPMECRWQPGKQTPPGTNYTLLYRCGEVNHPCKEYLHRQGVVTGCKFPNWNITLCSTINILITDSAMDLRPFYTSIKRLDILQPRPPYISIKLSHDKIYVEWNDTDYEIKNYEVEVKHSKSQTSKQFDASSMSSYTIDSARQDAMYTIRVRSKFNDFAGGKIWSDWSNEESIGEHQENDWTLRIILLLTVPLIVATATILLLVFMKRLQIVIFPPIPDPGKLLRGMFTEQTDELQHWIKHGSVNFPSKPVQEETCLVVLVEKEPSPETQKC